MSKQRTFRFDVQEIHYGGKKINTANFERDLFHSHFFHANHSEQKHKMRKWLDSHVLSKVFTLKEVGLSYAKIQKSWIWIHDIQWLRHKIVIRRLTNTNQRNLPDDHKNCQKRQLYLSFNLRCNHAYTKKVCWQRFFIASNINFGYFMS